MLELVDWVASLCYITCVGVCSENLPLYQDTLPKNETFTLTCHIIFPMLQPTCMNESEGTDTSLLYSYPRRGPKRSISGLFVMQPLLPRGRGEGKNKKTYSCPRNSSGFYSIGFFDKSELYGNVYDWQRVGMGWDRVVWGMGMAKEEASPATFHYYSSKVSLTVGCACLLWFFCWHRSIRMLTIRCR